MGFPVISFPRIPPTVQSWIFIKQFGFPEWAFSPISITTLVLFWLYWWDFPRGVFLFYDNDDSFAFFAAIGFHVCNNNNNNTNIPSYYSANNELLCWYFSSVIISFRDAQTGSAIVKLTCVMGRKLHVRSSRPFRWNVCCQKSCFIKWAKTLYFYRHVLL